MINRKESESIRQKPDCKHALLSLRNWFYNESSGFTIIEVLIVVFIIGVLATIAFFGYGTYVEKARVVSAISEINTITKDIRIYMVDHPTPPVDLAIPEIGYGNFNDPWGRPYQYVNHLDPLQLPLARTKPGTGIINPESDFDVYSMGRDGLSFPNIDVAQSHDDIIRAGDDHFIGKASRYQP